MKELIDQLMRQAEDNEPSRMAAIHLTRLTEELEGCKQLLAAFEETMKTQREYIRVLEERAANEQNARVS